MTWTSTLIAYGSVLTAITFGLALGYRPGRRSFTVLFGPLIGLCGVLISYAMLSDNPTPTLSDSPWSVTVRVDAIGFALFYLAAFGFAALAGAALRQRHNVLD